MSPGFMNKASARLVASSPSRDSLDFLAGTSLRTGASELDFVSTTFDADSAISALTREGASDTGFKETNFREGASAETSLRGARLVSKLGRSFIVGFAATAGTTVESLLRKAASTGARLMSAF